MPWPTGSTPSSRRPCPIPAASTCWPTPRSWRSGIVLAPVTWVFGPVASMNVSLTAGAGAVGPGHVRPAAALGVVGPGRLRRRPLLRVLAAGAGRAVRRPPDGGLGGGPAAGGGLRRRAPLPPARAGRSGWAWCSACSWSSSSSSAPRSCCCSASWPCRPVLLLGAYGLRHRDGGAGPCPARRWSGSARRPPPPGCCWPGRRGSPWPARPTRRAGCGPPSTWASRARR